MRILYGWKFILYSFFLYRWNCKIFLDGVSVLYIYGLSIEVRPPCFDSGCCLGWAMVDRPWSTSMWWGQFD